MIDDDDDGDEAATRHRLIHSMAPHGAIGPRGPRTSRPGGEGELPEREGGDQTTSRRLSVLVPTSRAPPRRPVALSAGPITIRGRASPSGYERVLSRKS
jgi:hypothetical protein